MKTFRLTHLPLAGVVACAAALASGSAGANFVNLTTAGASGTLTGQVGGTAIFSQEGLQAAGTGLIQPFLTIGAQNIEQGFNSDTTPEPLDVKRTNAGYTRSLLVSSVPVVSIAGQGKFYEFLLDINESNPLNSGDAFLSLEKVELFATDSPNIWDASSTLSDVQSAPSTSTVWQMQAADWVALNYDLEPGQGATDMYMYIPKTAVAATNFILYSHFGAQGTRSAADGLPAGEYGSSDGYEEWAVAVVPLPAAAWLFGSALLGMVGIGYRRRSTA